MTATLTAPGNVTADTSLGDPTGLTSDGLGSLDAPDFDFQLQMPTYDDFKSSQGFSPKGFTAGLSEQAGTGGAGVRGQVVDMAKQYLGMQYKWGGSNPKTSFDCSGFIQYVLGKFGVQMPRVSYQQVNSGKHIAISALQPGDIVGWDNSTRNKGADHVALYIGGGQIMEFYSSGHPSRIRKLGKNEGAIGVAIDYGKG